MKKLILFICLFMTSLLLVSCTKTGEGSTDIHDKYNVNKEIEIVEEKNKNKFISILNTAYEKEYNKNYCNFKLVDFIDEGEVIIKYDIRGEDTNKYQAEMTNDEIDTHLYIKDGYCYVQEDGEKRKGSYETVFGEYSKDELLYVFTFFTRGYPSAFLLKSLVESFKVTDPYMIFTNMGIDKDNNYVIDMSSDEGVVRFVFNESQEFLYMGTKTEEGEIKYCVNTLEEPTFKFPSFSDYVEAGEDF